MIPYSMTTLDFFFCVQGITTGLAISFNILLIYLIVEHSKTKLGFYKWIMVSYAVFEAVYSLVIFIGMPAHFVVLGSWLVFTNGGPLQGTRFAYTGPALYCSFYEMWLGFLIVHFVYRYLGICRRDLFERIGKSNAAKIVMAVFSFVFILGTFMCGFYLCTRQDLPKEIADQVEIEFNHAHMSKIGYILLRTKTSDGNYSIFGIMTILNHHILVAISIVVILFCSFGISRKIHEKMLLNTKTVKFQRQLFISLLLQTLVPVMFCHVPSIIYLLFPLIKADLTFGPFSLLFTWLTSFEKVIDPIIVIFCITEYRKAVMKIFGGLDET